MASTRDLLRFGADVLTFGGYSKKKAIDFQEQEIARQEERFAELERQRETQMETRDRRKALVNQRRRRKRMSLASGGDFGMQSRSLVGGSGGLAGYSGSPGLRPTIGA